MRAMNVERQKVTDMAYDVTYNVYTKQVSTSRFVVFLGDRL